MTYIFYCSHSQASYMNFTWRCQMKLVTFESMIFIYFKYLHIQFKRFCGNISYKKRILIYFLPRLFILFLSLCFFKNFLFCIVAPFKSYHFKQNNELELLSGSSSMRVAVHVSGKSHKKIY
jgi:hypothetical protein